MSTTEVQLRFAAEFALLLASLGGLGYAFLWADLLVALAGGRPCRCRSRLRLRSPPPPSWSGALRRRRSRRPARHRLADRRGGFLLLCCSSSSGGCTANGGRNLLWIGLMGLAVAEVALHVG